MTITIFIWAALYDLVIIPHAILKMLAQFWETIIMFFIAPNRRYMVLEDYHAIFVETSDEKRTIIKANEHIPQALIK